MVWNNPFPYSGQMPLSGRDMSGHEYAASGKWDNPYDVRDARISRGYLGYTQDDLSAMDRALKGKGSLTELGDPGLLTTEHGQSSRFLSRVGQYQYENDPRLQKYRKHIERLQAGGLEDKLRAVSREAIGRSQGAQRMGMQDALSSQMGGGAVAPGVGQYLNRKQDVALTGELGEAYRQAAVSDLNSRTMAGQMALEDQMMSQEMLNRIIAADTHNIDVQLQHKMWEKQPGFWDQVLGNAVGQAAGAAAGYFTGGAAGAVGGAGGAGSQAAPRQGRRPIAY